MVNDFEGLHPHKFMPQALGRSFCLTAEFTDLDAARRARQALRDADFAESDVVLLGKLGDEMDSVWGLCADEEIVARAMLWRVGAGAGGGALAGGVLVWLVGALAFGGGDGLWAAIVTGAVFGAIVGGLLGGVATTKLIFSEAELHRHHPELEHALLGVCDEDWVDVDRAEAILRELGAVRIERNRPAAEPVPV